MRSSASVTPSYKLVSDFLTDKDLLVKVMHSST